MFQAKTHHVCTVLDANSKSFLPVLPPIASNIQKWKRFLKKSILVSEMNPQSVVFLRRPMQIVDERKKQADSGSWIIHPFSMFRLYYEMWMTVIFMLCLYWMPMDCTFDFFSRETSVTSVILDYFLFVVSYIDIFFTFQTGACISKEDVVMKRGLIAKHYIFGIHFVPDLVSVLPDLYDFFPDEYELVCDFLSYCAILKIIRLITFLEYLTRSLNVEGFTALFIKVGIVSFLICHSSAALLFFNKLIYQALQKGHTARAFVGQLKEKQPDLDDSDMFINYYLKHFYMAASLLIGVDVGYEIDQEWLYYASSVAILITGKVLITFVTVMLIDIFKNTNFLEIKYYSMMSQVDSFMKAHQFPINLQKKIRKFYIYKYRQKYLNEPQIERYISDKLKREVKYHECRKLIQNLRLFQKFPQEILEEIVTKLKRELYLAKDVVIKAGSFGNSMYFVASGAVAVVTPSGKEVCHLVDGDYFGEICMLVPKARRTATVVALEFCEVYKMERRFFKKCLESNPVVLKEIQTEANRRHQETKEIESTFIKASKNLYEM